LQLLNAGLWIEANMRDGAHCAHFHQWTQWFCGNFRKNSHQLKKREVLWLDFTGRQ
jgi:hypothetical protein